MITRAFYQLRVYNIRDGRRGIMVADRDIRNIVDEMSQMDVGSRSALRADGTSNIRAVWPDQIYTMTTISRNRPSFVFELRSFEHDYIIIIYARNGIVQQHNPNINWPHPPEDLMNSDNDAQLLMFDDIKW